MRDVALIAVIVGLSLASLVRPWIGVLAWTWLSVMNPHQYSWAAAQMPVAAMVAGSTLVGLIISRDQKQFFLTRESGTLIAFIAWICITYPFSFSTTDSYEMWSKVMKIDFMILVTLVVLHSRRHVELFVWAVVLSLTVYGVKGGIFTIATGGQYRVWGPGGFIGGNNELALALIMVIPLMRFLQLQLSNRWLRRGFTVAIVLTAAAALGSQSRGALLAIVAMTVFLWLKSPGKLLSGIAMTLVGGILVAFMPESWNSRMDTIGTYQEDASAMGRINAWWMAWNLAKDRFFGGGFDIYTPEIFAMYAPDPLDVHAAHSIYFQVLGEHGFVGLFIFLLLWLFVWLSAGWLIRHGSRTPETMWCRQLGAMCQVSLVGYTVGGAFLSLAYFDLPYNLLVMVVLARRWLQSVENTAASETRNAATQRPTGLTRHDRAYVG